MESILVHQPPVMGMVRGNLPQMQGTKNMSITRILCDKCGWPLCHCTCCPFSMRPIPAIPVLKIISGGQTGADRAGLDFAIEHGIEHGGWCPRGRLAEDGPIPKRYNLIETESAEYPPRTAMNIRYSDATLVFNPGTSMERGCALTLELCVAMEKNCWLYHGQDDAEASLGRFLALHKPLVINIAGNRESKRPGIYLFTKGFLARTLIAPINQTEKESHHYENIIGGPQ